MTEMVLYHFLTDVPLASTIWTGLLLLTGVALVLLTLRTRLAEAATASAVPVPGRLSAALDRVAAALAGIAGRIGDQIRRRGRRAEQARDAYRYAGEVAVAAARAEHTVRRRHTEWSAVHDEVDAAWQQFHEADLAVRRLAGAAALPCPETARTPAEYADRERYLHRSAMAAYWRRELTVGQLTDALANRNGWDPRRHPVEQELALLAAVRDGRYRQYLAASERERAAWRAVETARAAARSLRAEAVHADGAAWRLRRWRPRTADRRDIALAGDPVTGRSIANARSAGWKPA
jgi:murein L,D-transpeptidase YcbB/YkuD